MSYKVVKIRMKKIGEQNITYFKRDREIHFQSKIISHRECIVKWAVFERQEIKKPMRFIFISLVHIYALKYSFFW